MMKKLFLCILSLAPALAIAQVNEVPSATPDTTVVTNGAAPATAAPAAAAPAAAGAATQSTLSHEEQIQKALADIDPNLTNPVAEAQKVDKGEVSSEGTIRIIPRLDFLSTSKTPDLYGASGFYTLFEGNIAEHFYWTLGNWWLAPPVDGDWWWLYKDLGRTDTSNWLQFCNVCFEWNGWMAEFGKDAIITDGFEMDNYDWELVSPFYTPLWNELACYQWGGTLGWTSKSGMTRIKLQATSSPLKDRIFTGGCYSFQYRGEYAWFCPLFGFSAVQKPDNYYDWWFNAGIRLIFGKWSITGEWSNFTGLLYDLDYNILGTALGNSAKLSVEWTPCEIVSASAVGEYNDRFWLAGAYAKFRPFQGRWREAVYFNAALSYRQGQPDFEDFYSTGPLFTVGAVMDLCLNLWK